MMTATDADQTYQQAVAARELAARKLYEAEVAAHDAHQTQVDGWIQAAHDRLHIAVTRYLAAEAALSALRSAPLVAAAPAARVVAATPVVAAPVVAVAA